MVELDACRAFLAYGFIADTPKRRKRRGDNIAHDDLIGALRTKYVGITIWCCFRKHYLMGIMVKLDVMDVSLPEVTSFKISFPIISGDLTAMFARQWNTCIELGRCYKMLELKLRWALRTEAQAESLGAVLVFGSTSCCKTAKDGSWYQNCSSVS